MMLLLVVGAAVYVLLPQLQPHTSLRIGDGVFKAYVAQTEEERTKGLSDTPTLASDAALIFIFPTDGLWPIWMKDMEYPIDIIWLNKDKTVVYITKNAAPDSFPKTFVSKEKARYVIELNAGTVDQKKISIGKKAVFDEAHLEDIHL